MTLPIIGAKADFHPRDYRYSRQRADRAWVEFERSAPLRSWAKDILAGLLLIAFMAGAFTFANLAADFMRWI